MTEKTKEEQAKEAIVNGEEALVGLKSLASEVKEPPPGIEHSWSRAAYGEEIWDSLPVISPEASVEEAFEIVGIVVDIPPSPDEVTEQDVQLAIEDGSLKAVLGLSDEKLSITPFDELMAGWKKFLRRGRRSLNHRLQTAISVSAKNGIPLDISWGMSDEELSFKDRLPGKILPRSAVEKLRESCSPEGSLKVDKKVSKEKDVIYQSKPTGRGRRIFGVDAEGNVTDDPVAVDKEGKLLDEEFTAVREEDKEPHPFSGFPRFTDDRHRFPMMKEYCRFVLDPSGLYNQRTPGRNRVMDEPWDEVKPFSMEETLVAVELLRHISLDEVKAWWTCPEFPNMVHSPSTGVPIFQVKDQEKRESSSQVGLDVSMTGYDGSAALLKRAMGQPDFARRLAKTISIVLEMYDEIENDIEDIKTPLSFKVRRGVDGVVHAGREKVGRMLAKAGEFLHGWAWKRVVPEKKVQKNYKAYVKGE